MVPLSLKQKLETSWTYVVTIDRRSAVLQLQQVLAKELDIDMGSFRTYAGYNITSCNEMKVPTRSIHSHNVVAGSLLTLAPTGNVPLNHFSITLYLHRAKYSLGVCNQPAEVLDSLQEGPCGSSQETRLSAQPDGDGRGGSDRVDAANTLRGAGKYVTFVLYGLYCKCIVAVNKE